MTTINHTTVQVTLKYHTPYFFDNLLSGINQTCGTRQPVATFRSGEYIKTWIKLETMYKPPQGHQVFSKVSFVTFDLAITEAIGNKSVLKSVLFYIV